MGITSLRAIPYLRIHHHIVLLVSRTYRYFGGLPTRISSIRWTLLIYIFSLLEFFLHFSLLLNILYVCSNPYISLDNSVTLPQPHCHDSVIRTWCGSRWPNKHSWRSYRDICIHVFSSRILPYSFVVRVRKVRLRSKHEIFVIVTWKNNPYFLGETSKLGAKNTFAGLLIK